MFLDKILNLFLKKINFSIVLKDSEENPIKEIDIHLSYDKMKTFSPLIESKTNKNGLSNFDLRFNKKKSYRIDIFKNKINLISIENLDFEKIIKNLSEISENFKVKNDSEIKKVEFIFNDKKFIFKVN